MPGFPIRELVFEFGGAMSVTWTPFETYYDYWGTYTYAQTQAHGGSLSLQITDGNYIPADFDGEGTFQRCGPDLFLFDLWLGSYDAAAPQAPSCGYRFRRR